ncbi:Hypothetical protein FKW44_005223 [Caligus rogercresseyi]|uniref:Uncharacterized protein n=1 Tax=Caligus rogercresseyi TaxID=217165 RepID=A0A7T8QRU4_CALRO|nr:Hypothetical protein FKW44_005223 [Caligus rogercresseyi]
MWYVAQNLQTKEGLSDEGLDSAGLGKASSGSVARPSAPCTQRSWPFYRK